MRFCNLYLVYAFSLSVIHKCLEALYRYSVCNGVQLVGAPVGDGSIVQVVIVILYLHNVCNGIQHGTTRYSDAMIKPATHRHANYGTCLLPP